jgi:enhancing lycopene biosynthesis protein 2
MAKRVGVILSGCGHRDGSDAAETLLALLIIDRAGGQAICAAPEPVRQEAARLLHDEVRPLAELDAAGVDALVIPGGGGVTTVLSDYAEKGQLCQVQPDVVRLLRALLQMRRPMGFVGLAGLLAARVLGPVAGVRLTLGSRGTHDAKHAAVMGADVRPCTADEVIVDQKSRVFSTPSFLVEGTRLAEVARAIDKMVRAVLAGAKDRAPRPPPPETTGRDRGSA